MYVCVCASPDKISTNNNLNAKDERQVHSNERTIKVKLLVNFILKANHEETKQKEISICPWKSDKTG